MRIHVVVAMYVLLFSLFFDLSNIEYIILITVIALVMAMELINTAVEEMVNISSPAYDQLARIAKDTAAGAVLITAIAAVFAGIFIFNKPAGFIRIYELFTMHPWLFVPFGGLLFLSVFYIFRGPSRMRSAFKDGIRPNKNDFKE